VRSGEWAARTDTPKRSVFGNYHPDARAPLTPTLSPSEGERENLSPSQREPVTAGCTSASEFPLGGGEGQGEGAVRAHASTLQTAIDLAISRSFVHRFLAKAYEDPAPDGWNWLCAPGTQESFRAAMRVVAAARQSAANSSPSLESSLQNLSAPFCRDAATGFRDAYIATFGHAARGGCPLNEIEYGDIKADPLFQPHRLADLAAFYRAFGLEVAEDAGERHDHICLELEFMCVLAAKEAYALEHQLDADQLAQCRDAQRNFLREHLGRWTPAFTRRLAATTSEPTLVALSELTRAFVESECARFGVKGGSEDLLLRPVDEAAESMCGSCGLNQLPPGALTTT
jgi:DMSO reductase family type II enzyme chaperone